jgi:hypothetical protein
MNSAKEKKTELYLGLKFSLTEDISIYKYKSNLFFFLESAAFKIENISLF